MIHLRAGAGVLAAAALLGTPVLMAAPASAAKAPSLTQTYCANQGGTFAKSQGVKTCTIQSAPGLPVVGNSYSARAYAPYTNVSADVISIAQLTADGYEARWTDLNTYQDTTVLTQKGGGAITTHTTSVLVQRQNTQEECWSLILAGGTYFYLAQAFPVQCAALGMYPAETP